MSLGRTNMLSFDLFCQFILYSFCGQRVLLPYKREAATNKQNTKYKINWQKKIKWQYILYSFCDQRVSLSYKREAASKKRSITTKTNLFHSFYSLRNVYRIDREDIRNANDTIYFRTCNNNMKLFLRTKVIHNFKLLHTSINWFDFIAKKILYKKRWKLATLDYR